MRRDRSGARGRVRVDGRDLAEEPLVVRLAEPHGDRAAGGDVVRHALRARQQLVVFVIKRREARLLGLVVFLGALPPRH